MPTANLFWEPPTEQQLVQQLLETLRIEIHNSVEYHTACDNAKDDYLVFGDKLSQERVELNALIMMLMNYRRIKKECKINALR